ncbi:hypothetical protein DB44_CA00110 [Candidatus Protochlamydia amoebophila]|uniref:Uncharacterized protein n=1 Tax=Candidatus Protochlamydia amoebophila TaxID=362787 RepID=A0A0C1H5N4_9BACT|nr:hypothetical protein DB44_CA00110 [Candidatus Protochlamydia amoebophila]
MPFIKNAIVGESSFNVKSLLIEKEIKILAWVTNYFIVENLQIRARFKGFIQLKGF